MTRVKFQNNRSEPNVMNADICRKVQNLEEKNTPMVVVPGDGRRRMGWHKVDIVSNFYFFKNSEANKIHC